MRKILGLAALVLSSLTATGCASLVPEGMTLRLLDRAVADAMSRDDLADLPDGIHVMLCGAGSPLADIKRSGPCVAVQAGEHLYIIDAGTNGARNLGRFFVDVGRVEAVFLTHAHSDHIDGLGELGMLRWLNRGGNLPLPVHGPPVVEGIVAGFNQAYAADIGYRVAHQGADFARANGAGLEAFPFPVPEDGELATVLETPDGVRISAFTVEHEPVTEAVGYRIDYGGRSVAISGDTKKSDNLIRHSRGVDLLLHEALDSRLTNRIAAAAEKAGNTRAAQMMRDVASYHATPVEAAESAAEAGAAHLLFYHIAPQLPAAPLERIFLKGVGDVYTGKVTLGTDGTRISLPAVREKEQG
ncbi:MAG: MBL fold metallo-hydrolase [Gemmatimonadetes bacterium]|nr:MBL fold metallo-hydrolase [Gemmatimonadota bacterium]MYE92281.1 MBL fold metallo-hydrolase [Gemmatimonadota bacterium]MYJ10045.1 MBL fold metallo-hydrolase [Gemmatimonadota bacterium]